MSIEQSWIRLKTYIGLGAVNAPEDEYLEGMIVRILGMEVYNSVE